MSITREAIFAAQPATTRATPTPLSVDPKGERIAYASGKSVFLRSIDDPSISRQYTAHTAVVNVARFSPSGYYVASGDAAGTVRVWDCAGEDMTTKGEFHIISGPIKDLAWDGESKRIIAVGDGKERFGHCITFDTGNSVGEISGHSSIINSVSIRQQRPYRAATASDDQTVAFFHGAPFKFATSLSGRHSNFVHGVAFSPDGERFVSVGADRKIFLFDGKTGDFAGEVAADHAGSIFAVSWAPDSKSFVTASADQTVKLWALTADGNSAQCTHTWALPGGLRDHQVGVVFTARADGLVLSLSLSGDLQYLLPGSTSPARTVHGHQKSITALAASTGNTLLTGSYDGAVCVWDLSKGTARSVTGESHTNTVSAFVTYPDTVFSAGWDDKLRPLDITSATFVAGTAVPTDAQPLAASLLGGIDGKFIALLTAKELRIYAAAAPAVVAQPLVALPLKFTPTALAADPAPGATMIAVGAQDNTIRRFTFSPAEKSLAEVPALTANRAFATALAFDPTGTYLAAGDSSGKIVLYEGAAVKTTRWAFHTGRVADIAWNKKGSHVATVSLDTNVYVYSLENPAKKAAAKNAHMGGVNGVAWTVDDKIATAGADGAVKTWAVTLP